MSRLIGSLAENGESAEPIECLVNEPLKPLSGGINGKGGWSLEKVRKVKREIKKFSSHSPFNPLSSSFSLLLSHMPLRISIK